MGLIVLGFEAKYPPKFQLLHLQPIRIAYLPLLPKFLDRPSDKFFEPLLYYVFSLEKMRKWGSKVIFSHNASGAWKILTLFFYWFQGYFRLISMLFCDAFFVFFKVNIYSQYFQGNLLTIFSRQFLDLFFIQRHVSGQCTLWLNGMGSFKTADLKEKRQFLLSTRL